MRFTLRLCQDLHTWVRIGPPSLQDLVCQFNQLFLLLRFQTNDGHRPFDNTCFHLIKSAKSKATIQLCYFHREGMTSALIVVVGQDRSADNRQVGIWACEIAWKGLDDVQQALKGQPANGHRKVLAVQKDAMFIKISIGRILEAPLLSSQIKSNNPMVGAGWVIQATLVTFIFHAKLASWIMAILSLFSCRNLLGILFWLR